MPGIYNETIQWLWAYHLNQCFSFLKKILAFKVKETTQEDIILISGETDLFITM